jgi:Ser/Thr protein kinase RdoA (MazF antagonist)
VEDIMVSRQDSAGAGKPLEQATLLARAALRHYELPGFKLKLLKEQPNKQIFRVSSLQRGNFLLRMYVPPAVQTPGQETRTSTADTVIRSEAGLRSQMLWLADLRRTMRLPVPEPVAMVDGSLAGNVSVGSVPGSRNFALLRWVPGELKSGDLSSAQARSFGSYIARLHRHAEQYTVPEGFQRPRWDWEHLFGMSSLLWSRGEVVFSEEEMQALRITAERVRQELQATGETRDAFGIIHHDLHPENIVYHGGVLYAIDFDHCGWGYYLYDLAMPYSLLSRPGQPHADMREALLEGYQRERSLPEGYQKRLEVFVAMQQAMSIYSALGVLQRVPLARVPEQPIWKRGKLQHSIKKLKEFAAREDSKF